MQGATVGKKEKEQDTNIAGEEEQAPALQDEPASPEGEGGAQDTALQQAEKELEKARAAAEDFKRKWYSVSAEYENYRRRTNAQSAQRYQEGRADVVAKLFPIADDLERALAHCGDEGTRKGISMVVDTFAKLLESEKIVVIDPVGQPFDAETMEAVMAVEAADGEESGLVREVYRKGYEQNGKVLRFAQVVVVR